MSIQPQSQPNSGWVVTGQSESTIINDSNNVVSGVTVYFRTGNGTAGSVFVPQNLYTPDNVRAMIAQKAAQLDAVDRLSAPPA